MTIEEDDPVGVMAGAYAIGSTEQTQSEAQRDDGATVDMNSPSSARTNPTESQMSASSWLSGAEAANANGAAPHDDTHETQSGNGAIQSLEPPQFQTHHNGLVPSEADEEDLAEPVLTPLGFAANDPVPGYEHQASDCLNRALHIARSLNHTSLSSDHLIVALTMDQSARKLLERVGDVEQLRNHAMRRLGKMNWKFIRPAGDLTLLPMQTSDLEDIRKKALDAAAERNQKVAINDLIAGFPSEGGRLTYGVKDDLDALPAVLERVERGLVPRVVAFMSQFESELRATVQRELTIAAQNATERQMTEVQERQLAALQEASRQIVRDTEVQLARTLLNFSERTDELLARLSTALPQAPQTPTPSPKGGYWSWIGLV